MRKQDILSHYLFWLTSLVCDEYHQRYYQSLLELLHEKEFVWMIDNDANRAADGIDLRARFSEEERIDFFECRRILNGPCSVLEMMVGLACRCEDGIMGDEEYGDRTSKWFWMMIQNLNLMDMDDESIDVDHVHEVVDKMLHRSYDRTGRNGGLFIVNRPRRDLRKVEIWYQLNWYLDTIIN